MPAVQDVPSGSRAMVAWSWGRGDGRRTMFASVRTGVRRIGRAIQARVGCVAAERGAATAEYTLVTLVAATVAFLLLNWAKGGALTNFFQTIFDKVVALFA